MKTVYVVWKMNDSSLRSDTIEIEGKINHWTVEKTVREHLGYYNKYEFDRIISWQVEEEFTDEEHDKFWENYQ